MSYTDNFINNVKDGAIASMQKHRVLASITIAQAILESGWGQSALATESKNLFGVKAIGGWDGAKKLYPTYEYSNGQRIKINDYFRVYNSYTESIEDHALFLVNNSRYRENGLFNAKDYIGQANALVRAGYATDPGYANQLISLIQQYELNKYDLEEEKKVENLVVYNFGADERAAEYLADYLNCPTIANSRKFDYSTVKNVYAVGGKKEQYTGYVKTVISGGDRYSTMQAVLNFINKK